MGAMASPLLGPAGNAEFFLHARAHVAADGALQGTALESALDAALSESPG